MSVITAIASALCKLRVSTFTIEPSRVSTTDERRRVALDEHQRGLVVTHRAPRGLREGTRRMQV